MKKPVIQKASIGVFAANLMMLMTQKGVDISDMHKDLSIGMPRIRSWTKGECFPTHDMMVRLCQYFQYYDIYKLITQHIALHQTVCS